MGDLNPFDAHPLRREEPKPEAKRQELVRLQEHLANQRPRGPLARIRWRFQRRQLRWVLDWMDAGRTRSEAIAEYRGRIKFVAPALFAVTLAQALWPGQHPLTLARVLVAVGVSSVGAIAFAIVLQRQAPKMADSEEKLYAKWLDRARALGAPREAEGRVGEDSAP